jgi:UDP-N-acetylmuramoyl-L-alanyl-D-glutamate--2,6-diaminopimelate ligase
MQEKGERNLVMEVSSIGVVENRITGIPFAVKALTNITQDHLDYHKTFKAYTSAKMTFLKLPGPTVFPRDYRKIAIDFPVLLQGRFNRCNLQTAYAIAKHLGVSDEVIKASLATAKPPKGRFEMIPSSSPFKVFIDYAHTPDGLDNILRTAKEITSNKLIVVFGAGGNRDTTKRPLMGKVADLWADTIIITSDNPRLEAASSIINQIKDGVQVHTPIIIEDRRHAIQTAIEQAKKGDVIVIAGKGHETYQIIGTETIPFDDTEVAQSFLS